MKEHRCNLKFKGRQVEFLVASRLFDLTSDSTLFQVTLYAFNMRGLMKINNEVTEYLFDTGASQTVINYYTFEQINNALNKPVMLQPSNQICTSAKIMQKLICMVIQTCQ